MIVRVALDPSLRWGDERNHPRRSAAYIETTPLSSGAFVYYSTAHGAYMSGANAVSMLAQDGVL